MKSKFIGAIVAIAVVLSMVMVPAVPGVAVAAAGDAGLEITPAETKVGFTQDFDLEIWTDIAGSDTFDGVGAYLNFSTTYMQVNFITNGSLPMVLGHGQDNGLGTVDYAAGSLTPVTGPTLVCTLNCTSKGVTGVSTIDFVIDGALRTTDVTLTGGSIINWSMVTDATLKVGSPALTVNVTPAGKGNVDVTGLSVPSSYPNVSYWTWGDVVQLTGQDPAAGWEFSHWSGNLSGSTNPDTVTMDDARSVMAHFVELPCVLDVDPNTVNIEARFSAVGEEGSDTITIKNDGGGVLRWQVGYPPILGIGDNWVYANIYGASMEMMTMVVTDDTDLHVYDVDISWAPSANRTIIVTDPPMGPVPAVMVNATAKMDKCGLDFVQQKANLLVWITAWVPATAELLWTYNGCHGWPYYGGKSWSYDATQQLVVMGVPNPLIILPTCYATVTGFTNYCAVTNTTLPVYCWEITHYVDPTNATTIAATTFKQEYWNDASKAIEFQWDGATFAYPPVDVRSLQVANLATLPPPACCNTTSWLSFDKLSCNLLADETVEVTVTANSSGLDVGVHNGTFCVSSCCCSGVNHQCVNVSFNVLPATSLEDVFRDLPADALDYDAEYPGMTFDVYVNFTAPVDEFNSIGLTDYAPPGWVVATDNSWCVPPASFNKSNYNKAEYAWAGPYDVPTNFSAKYEVTIPATASPGSNFWPECDAMPCPPCGGSPINNYPAWIEYWFGAAGPYETVICEEREKIVTVPGCVVGETRDVVGDVLDTVLVSLYEDDDVWEDNDSSSIVGGIAVYQNCANDTGMYYQIADKYCYFPINTRPEGDGGSMPSSRNPAYPDYIDWSTPELLAAGNVTNFVGDYGLICKAASISMAMEAVNHMLFVPEEPLGVPHPDWRLSGWKVTQVVNSWQFPAGCACC